MNIFQLCLSLSLILSTYLCTHEATDLPQVVTSSLVNEKLLVENQTITAYGQKLIYDVHGGSITVHNKEPKETGDIHYIAYFSKSAQEKGKRPIAFCFNGGPGSSSVWLHIGFLGPKIISGQNMLVPNSICSLHDNPYSLLAFCDLVFIDPVSTGFSNISNEKNERKFFGVQEDLRSLADFIQLFLSKFQRWESPKLLIGESYGTARAVGLTHLLQNEYFLNIDGLILISLVLDFQTLERSPSHDLCNVLNLPTYAAIAQYHKKLNKSYSEMPVKDLSAAVCSFAVNEYLPSLFKGNQLPENSEQLITQHLSEFTSLTPSFFHLNNLRINSSQFRKKLFEGSLLGRLDGRVMTWNPPKEPPVCEHIDGEPTDPSCFFVFSGFTTAMNEYLNKDLKWPKEEPYVILNYDALTSWNWNTSAPGFGYTCFVQDLRLALAKNPNLKVFAAAGYFDLATPFFGQQYTLNHLFVPENVRKNIAFKTYEAGHMVYLDEKARKELSSDLSRFIQSIKQ